MHSFIISLNVHSMTKLLAVTPEMQNWFLTLEKFFWCGFAALGFAILFNVPKRTLFMIAILGATGGLTKFILLHYGFSVVIAPLCGATLIGILSIPVAHYRHAPPLIFYIPAVIPMIPGIFAYRMMLGLIKLIGDPHVADYTQNISETVNNGLKVFFIIMSLAVGVAFPMLITRKESVKDFKAKKLKLFKN